MMEKIEALVERLENIIANLDFEPLKKILRKLHLEELFEKNISEKFILKAFGIILALISAVSVAVTISEITDKPEDETTSAIETTEASQAGVFFENRNEIKGNFLLLLNAEESQDVYLIAVVRLDSENNTMNISFLNKNFTKRVLQNLRNIV